MCTILFVFVASIAIMIERWFQLYRVRSVNRKMWDVLLPMLDKGAHVKPRTVISIDKSAMLQMLGI